jgi:hypothetical protein
MTRVIGDYPIVKRISSIGTFPIYFRLWAERRHHARRITGHPTSRHE